jgi:hypothetical protein
VRAKRPRPWHRFPNLCVKAPRPAIRRVDFNPHEQITKPCSSATARRDVFLPWNKFHAAGVLPCGSTHPPPFPFFLSPLSAAGRGRTADGAELEIGLWQCVMGPGWIGGRRWWRRFHHGAHAPRSPGRGCASPSNAGRPRHHGSPDLRVRPLGIPPKTHVHGDDIPRSGRARLRPSPAGRPSATTVPRAAHHPVGTNRTPDSAPPRVPANGPASAGWWKRRWSIRPGPLPPPQSPHRQSISPPRTISTGPFPVGQGFPDRGHCLSEPVSVPAGTAACSVIRPIPKPTNGKPTAPDTHRVSPRHVRPTTGKSQEIGRTSGPSLTNIERNESGHFFRAAGFGQGPNRPRERASTVPPRIP